MRTFEVTILCACMVGRQRCRVVAHIYYHGVGEKLRSSKTRKKLTFYANKISRQAVARRIPGRLWKTGYHIDPRIIPDTKGCDFFERRGEKRIDVGTLLTFRKNFVSDGVLCFWSILCVILLSVEVKTICKYACAHNRHIDVYTWNPYLHTCNPNLLTSGSLSLSTFIARCRHRRRHHRCRRRRRRPRPRRHNYPLAWRLFPPAIAATVVFAARC